MTAEAGAPPQPQVILAFDFGARRIGVASGDTLTRTARPLTTLECAGAPPWPAIQQLLEEYEPSQLVVGLPLHMDGTPTTQTEASRRFARQLKGRFARPVALVDERLSSREAETHLRRARAEGLKRRRVTHGDIDMIAARVLLERWLDDPSTAEDV